MSQDKLSVKYAREFWENEIPVFALHGFTGKRCACGEPECQAAGKHPRISNWQRTPIWDEEQMETLEEYGFLDSGYGVLCKGLLVIDVDVRNGGAESYARLIDRIPAVASAGLIVATGRGDGGKHLYFKMREPIAMVQHLQGFDGLDFKSSGYVVGPGSRHVAGGVYSVSIGSVADIDYAPDALIELLRKPEKHRAEYDGRSVDVSHGDIADMLSYIEPDCPYDQWIKLGMAIHHATGGTGLALWDEWSSKGDKYNPDTMNGHWHSFGRSINPVTLGTLIHYAEQGGWQWPVTFGGEAEPITVTSGDFAFDPLRPPGMLSEVVDFISSRQRRPLKQAALGTALWVTSCLFAGYTDDVDGVSPNLITFIVAGSGAGKEATQKAGAELVRIAGYAPAIHGTIKSEKEIVENLLRHQCAHYQIDEVGELLTKIRNAQKRGGAAHHEGTIGMIMSAFSKADSFLLIGGDRKEEARQSLLKEMATLQKKIDEDGEKPHLISRMASVQRQMHSIDNGIERPYLTINGFTVPATFDLLMDQETATNGFMRRALVFHDRDTAPRTKDSFISPPVPERLASFMRMIGTNGQFDTIGARRIELPEVRAIISTTAGARQALTDARHAFDDIAVQQRSTFGLEALYMGAYELVSKVSLLLAAWEGVRDIEHVKWANELVRRDVEAKALAVTANDRVKDSPKTALRARIIGLCSGESGETVGSIVNKCRKFKPDDVRAQLSAMQEEGILLSEEVQPDAKGGRPSIRYKVA